MLRPLAFQSIIIAVVLVMIVALLFIPDAMGSVAIAFSIISIATGVIGYMAFWNVNLDHVSAGSLFMCIGFSVDFSAHITYTYLSSKETTSEGKIRDSMFSLGLPIIQGGLSTVLSLITFLLIPGYGYRTFFKTIFLVTIFAAYHSIILIPLFLSTVEDLIKKYKKSDNRKSALDYESEGIKTMDIKRLENGSMKRIHRSFQERSIDDSITRTQEIDLTDIPRDFNGSLAKDEDLGQSDAKSEDSGTGSDLKGGEGSPASTSVEEGIQNVGYVTEEDDS